MKMKLYIYIHSEWQKTGGPNKCLKAYHQEGERGRPRSGWMKSSARERTERILDG
jgi:hypothetical protein